MVKVPKEMGGGVQGSKGALGLEHILPPTARKSG
jgi:hypothetical protein